MDVLTVLGSLTLQTISIAFMGVPAAMDGETIANSHGAVLTASVNRITGESTTVFRNTTDGERRVWIGIPRFSIGGASADFDVTCEVGQPDRTGRVEKWFALDPARAPHLVSRLRQPVAVANDEVDWHAPVTVSPLLVSFNIPGNGTRPLRLRFSTPPGSIQEPGGKATRFLGAAYSLATHQYIDLLSASISAGSGVMVPIPQANRGFQIGTSGTAIRLTKTQGTNQLMRLILFPK